MIFLNLSFARSWSWLTTLSGGIPDDDDGANDLKLSDNLCVAWNGQSDLCKVD